MKKKALALGITMALALPGMASAAIMDYGYDGGKLSSKDGPGYQPQQTIDDVQASAAVQERSRRLQDQPDAQTEKVTLAGQETVTEQKEREERGEKVASESTLPITIYGDQVTYNSESGDFKATGNVRLYQGNQKLYTTEATGNSKNRGCVPLDRGPHCELQRGQHQRHQRQMGPLQLPGQNRYHQGYFRHQRQGYLPGQHRGSVPGPGGTYRWRGNHPAARQSSTRPA